MKKNSDVNDLIEVLRSVDDYHICYLKSKGLTRGSFFLLYYLRRNPEGLEPSEIADLVLIKRQLTTALLNQFEQCGYLHRRVSRHDHRKRIVTLSRQGECFFDEVYQELCTFDRCGLDQLTPEEREQLISLLHRYRQGLPEQEFCKI